MAVKRKLPTGNAGRTYSPLANQSDTEESMTDAHESVISNLRNAAYGTTKIHYHGKFKIWVYKQNLWSILRVSDKTQNR